MRWIVIAVVVATACGGAKIPVHSGYKSDKSKPWKKPKALNLDDKGETKTEGELSYAEFRRARWYQITLPSHGELTVKLEITPPGDGVNDDFDLGVEIYDPKFRVIARSDLESQEDVGELQKTRQLVDLDAGKYLVHVYLQGRLDSADFLLRAAFKATREGDSTSDFPAQVAFAPPLPMVPITDDTPPGRITRPTTSTRPTGTRTTKPVDPPPPPPPELSARIMGISVIGSSTKVTLGIGTDQKAQSGMKARIGSLGPVPIECTASSCSAVFPNVTPDAVRAAGGRATLTP